MTISATGTAITVLGSINMDVVLRVACFPQPGETVLAAAVTKHPGGKGANQAIAAARAGAAVCMIGRVGEDHGGSTMLSLLKAEGIDTDTIEVDSDHPTGTAYVSVDASGENQIIVAAGANAFGNVANYRAEGVLLAQLELPLGSVVSFLSARREGSLAILNGAPFHPDAGLALSLADIVIVNEVELARYRAAQGRPASSSHAAEMARGLISRTGQTIVVTRGKAGSVAIGPAGVFTADAAAAQVVDTTGAGDCFCGFLAAGIASGQALAPSIIQAHKAAAMAVTRWGAASSMPFLAELGTAQ